MNPNPSATTASRACPAGAGCHLCGLCGPDAPAMPDDGVPSPCIHVCRINEATGWCEGCFRQLEEIAGWPLMSAADKRLVLMRAGLRRALQAQPKAP